jgi:hypothetical protein
MSGGRSPGPPGERLGKPGPSPEQGVEERDNFVRERRNALDRAKMKEKREYEGELARIRAIKKELEQKEREKKKAAMEAALRYGSEKRLKDSRAGATTPEMIEEWRMKEIMEERRMKQMMEERRMKAEEVYILQDESESEKSDYLTDGKHSRVFRPQVGMTSVAKLEKDEDTEEGSEAGEQRFVLYRHHGLARAHSHPPLSRVISPAPHHWHHDEELHVRGRRGMLLVRPVRRTQSHHNRRMWGL